VALLFRSLTESQRPAIDFTVPRSLVMQTVRAK
jgi:hypothetical protein